ncbi:hypothetical protein ACKI1Z_42540, partial [Streptomyces galilaeus]|uniref:hypothetical protein n=1 Tax=Streptomyces galilaeus TaxID=33899 RepID=UPI0038F79EFD
MSIKAGGAITHKDQFDFLLCPFTPEQKSTVREIIETFEEIESRSPETNWDKELSLNPENYTTLHWEHSV